MKRMLSIRDNPVEAKVEVPVAPLYERAESAVTYVSMLPAVYDTPSVRGPHWAAQVRQLSLDVHFIELHTGVGVNLVSASPWPNMPPHPVPQLYNPIS